MSETNDFLEKETLEQTLIRLLMEKGPKDSEVMKLLLDWTILQEKEVESLNELDSGVKFNLKRARLYYSAGFIEEAKENFADARLQALQLGLVELCTEIDLEISKIK